MLEELRQYENLGTPAYFWELFQNLNKGNSWTTHDVSGYFFNRAIDGKSIFDGCIPLLIATKIVAIDETGFIEVNYPYKNLCYSQQFLKQKLLEGILLALEKDTAFIDLFSSEHISYDFIHKSININLSVFGFRYANMRHCLFDFGFLIPHPDFPRKILIITPRWKQFFEKHFTRKIRARKINVEDLQKRQEQQQINGETAERFVLAFEKARLNDKSGIQWIAPYDSGAGFDILSFQGVDSKDNDLFIEVKSYSGMNPYFYWTRNEIKKAREYPDNYHVYLVNRDQLSNPRYQPRIISNPVVNILHDDEWKKEIDKYYITEN